MEIIIVLAAIYMLPTIVAAGRRAPRTMAIGVLNVFLGWTGLGWIAALVWAFADLPRTQTVLVQSSDGTTKAVEIEPQRPARNFNLLGFLVLIALGFALVYSFKSSLWPESKTETLLVAGVGGLKEVTSPDGRFTYSLRDKWATSSVVVRRNNATGEQIEIIDGNAIAVFNGGRIAVERHTYKPEGGSFECVFIADGDGHNPKKISDDKQDMVISALADEWPSQDAVACD